MIKVTDKYAINVDNNCYTTGKITYNKKQDVETLIYTRYFTSITSAITDIVEREAKDSVSDKDLTLKEALIEIKNVYDSFDNKIDELKKILKKEVVNV